MESNKRVGIKDFIFKMIHLACLEIQKLLARFSLSLIVRGQFAIPFRFFFLSFFPVVLWPRAISILILFPFLSCLALWQQMLAIHTSLFKNLPKFQFSVVPSHFEMTGGMKNGPPVRGCFCRCRLSFSCFFAGAKAESTLTFVAWTSTSARAQPSARKPSIFLAEPTSARRKPLS